MIFAGRQRSRESGRAHDDRDRVTGGAAPVTAATVVMATRTRVSATVAAVLLFVLPGCSMLSPPHSEASFAGRRFTSTVRLHGQPLDLHLSAPRAPAAPRVLVLYASGDGGWFGTAVDMFRQAADAGYFTVGFSSRSFMRLQRPRGSPLTAARLAAEYQQIVAQARTALGLDPTIHAVLTGWSRGAAFAVLVGAETAASDDVIGVVAIGLAEGEDLVVSGTEDDTDDGNAPTAERGWPYMNYASIGRLGPRPCAVIQATHDGYLPAARARQLFGPDTPLRRFYTIDAKNHRFAGGKAEFSAAWLDAIRWMAAPPAGGAMR
jgi:hypothetical protein